MENMSDFFAPELAGSEEALPDLSYLTILEQTALDTYAGYLAYRVQRDLYALCKDAAQSKEDAQFDHISWNDFVQEVRHCRRTRSAARIVLRRTLGNFLDHGEYRFDVSHVKLLRENDALEADGDLLQFAPLFSPEQGRGLVDVLLLHTEQAYYQYLRSQGAVRTWRQFLYQMLYDPARWQAMRMVFHDVLSRLDFKPVWQAEDLADAAAREEANLA